MLTNRIKKIIFLMGIALAACGGIGVYIYYTNTPQGPIYDFNPARDTQAIMDIFHQNWYWLLASEDSSPSFMIKHRTPDTNPMHFGSLHIKVLYVEEQPYFAPLSHKASEGSRKAEFTLSSVEGKGKLAGFTAYYMETPQQGRLLFLAVGHEFRGKGYGKILAEYAMEQLFAMGADHIALWTRVSNLPAQRIYKELGFKEMFDENGYVFFEYHL